jgi:hypothetical protein
MQKSVPEKGGVQLAPQLGVIVALPGSVAVKP